MKCSLIILTLNEIDGVRAFIPQLVQREVADEILAVDGNSTDGTHEFLTKYNIPVFNQTKKGRGEAFRVGMDNSTGDLVVFFSPDGNEDPADIPKLFAQLIAGADMVIASRFLPGAQNEEDDEALPLRKWVNQAFTLLANLIWNFGHPFITDTINGFRGISRTAFKQLAPSSLGYTIEYELTINAMRNKMKIVEIPTIENKRIGGETKGASWPTGIKFMHFFLNEVNKDMRKSAYFWPYITIAGGLLMVIWILIRSRSKITSTKTL